MADDPPDPGRVDQVTDFLRERSWYDVASFCSYHQQMERLNLRPWQQPPCWILDVETADKIIAKGPVLSMAGSGEDIGDSRCARLTKRMIKSGVSVFHPNPVEAIRVAQKKATRR